MKFDLSRSTLAIRDEVALEAPFEFRVVNTYNRGFVLDALRMKPPKRFLGIPKPNKTSSHHPNSSPHPETAVRDGTNMPYLSKTLSVMGRRDPQTARS